MTKRPKGLPKMKINNFKGYKYRRYTVALRLLALAWLPYALHTYFIFPSFASALASILLAVLGAGPLWMFSRHTEALAKDEFANLRAMNKNKQTSLLGVVSPKKN